MEENNFSDYYAVIMAGGGGTRLWPLSRKKNPKQSLQLIGKKSLFQLAVDRLRSTFPMERILVVSIEEQAEQLHKQVPEIPGRNFLLEPFPRGTASVVGYAAIFLEKMHPGSIMAVLTADHIIRNVNIFEDLLLNAYAFAKKDHLVTLGIEPEYPATGYGYIESGKPILNDEEIEVKHVNRFVEKPDEDTAKDYLQRGNFYWNSGMFVWKAELILKEFMTQMPTLYKILDFLKKQIENNNFEEILKKQWAMIKPQTIDYGIMEHADNVIVLPAKGLQWSDIGSWDSLYEIHEVDQKGNVIISNENIVIDSCNCLVVEQETGKLVALSGVEDLIVIDTPNSLLICPKGSSQNVREIVDKLRKRKLDRYL